jgi:hypothetical protein
MAIEITGDSPQAVALRMVEVIALNEGKTFADPTRAPDRKWLLSTYEACIEAVLSKSRYGAFG